MEEPSEKRYPCNECNYSTNSSTDIRRHLRKHSGERPYPCALCDKSFTSPGNRNRHQMTHSKIKRFQCEICLVKFTEKGTLVKHTRIHTGENLFKCKFCGKKFYQRGSMIDHEMLHTGEKRCFCSVCGKGFRHKAYLEEHSYVHQKMDFPCDKCDKVFKSLGSFKKHQRIDHENKKTVCKVCGEEFVRLENCLTHMKHTHQIENVYRCKICSEKFKSRYTLMRHKLAHQSDKLFHCSKCNDTFESKEALKIHIKDYKESFYCCPLCNIGFLSTSDLYKHWPAHRGKPCICKICKEVFPSKTAFRFHKHASVLKKEWKCPFCTKNFDLKKSAVRHIRAAHASIEEIDPDEPRGNLEKNLHCSLCEEKFSCKKLYIWHAIFVHNNPNIWTSHDKANAVGHDASVNDALPEELIPDYTDDKSNFSKKNWKCPFCAKDFRLKGNLVKHIRNMHESFEDNLQSPCSSLQERFPCVSCKEPLSSERSLIWHDIFVHKSLKLLKATGNITKPVGYILLADDDIDKSVFNDLYNEDTSEVEFESGEENASPTNPTLEGENKFDSNIVYIKEERMEHDVAMDSPEMEGEKYNIDHNVIGFTSALANFVDIKEEPTDTLSSEDVETNAVLCQ